MLKKILFIPDTHRPYHDKRAWALVLKAAKFFSPDSIVLLGDFADFYSVSFHSKDPRRVRRLDSEIEDVRLGLKELSALGAKERTYIAGNHEDRLSRYLQEKAPELNELISIPDALKLEESGWKYIPYRQDTRIGKVYATHDIGAAGRNSIFRCLDSYQHSNVTGHTHRMAYIVEGNAAGEMKVSAQFGWLGSVEAADYMHRMKARKDWALGFGIGYQDEDGIVHMFPIPIVKYTCVVEGKHFRG